MMANDTLTDRSNGHRRIRLGDTTPERVEVEVNGRTLLAWDTTNGRYPSGIAAELDDARNEYAAKRTRIFDGPPPPDLVESVRMLVEAVRTDGTLPDEAMLTKLIAEQQRALEAYDATPQWTARETDWSAYITRCLMTLIPGLEEQEAELMDTEKRFTTLIALGYFKSPTVQAEQEAESNNAPQPAASSAHSTGVEPERTSPASTE